MTQTKEQITDLLHKNGLTQTKEDKFGNILIKGQHGIDAYMQQSETGNWSPVVNIQWVNIYVLVPALAASMGLAALGIKGFGAMIGCAFLGLGAGTAVLRPKQKDLEAQLENIFKKNKK